MIALQDVPFDAPFTPASRSVGGWRTNTGAGDMRRKGHVRRWLSRLRLGTRRVVAYGRRQPALPKSDGAAGNHPRTRRFHHPRVPPGHRLGATSSIASGGRREIGDFFQGRPVQCRGEQPGQASRFVVDDERAFATSSSRADPGGFHREDGDGWRRSLTMVRDWSPDASCSTDVAEDRRLGADPALAAAHRGADHHADRARRRPRPGRRTGSRGRRLSCKPFDVAELIARIHTVLRRPKLGKVNNLRFADLSSTSTSAWCCGAIRRSTVDARVRPAGDADAAASPCLHPRRIAGFGVGQRPRGGGGDGRDLHLVSAREDRPPSERKLLQTIRGVGYALRDR